MFRAAATRWRGWRSCPPRPKIAVVSCGTLVNAGMPAWRGAAPPSAFSRALKSARVTREVSAVWSERSSTVTCRLPASAAATSASGNGWSNLTETTPTFRPCERR